MKTNKKGSIRIKIIISDYCLNKFRKIKQYLFRVDYKWWLGIIIGIITSFYLGIYFERRSSMSYEELIYKGDKYFIEHNVDKAIQTYIQASIKDFSRAEIFQRIGSSYIAFECLKQDKEISSIYLINYWIGTFINCEINTNSEETKENLYKAIKAYNRAVELSKSDEDRKLSYLGLGVAYYLYGDIVGSENNIKKSLGIKYEPDHITYQPDILELSGWGALAYIYEKLNKPKKIIEECKQKATLTTFH